jgi:hypothetical protein
MIIRKNNNFTENNKEIEEALLDYLKTFDAIPEIENKIKLVNQIIKVKWNEAIEDEQVKAIEAIAQLANLLTQLRGSVFISESKTKNHSNSNENNQGQQQLRIEGQDYDTDFSIIGDPTELNKDNTIKFIYFENERNGWIKKKSKLQYTLIQLRIY